MLVTDPNNVYESPDGGKTVYVRERGSNERKLHYISPGLVEEMKEKKTQQDWLEIRHAAKTNPALQKAIDHVIMLYHLSKTEEPVAWHPV